MAKLSRKLINFLKRDGFSPFEISVYSRVASIPSGSTRSYKWVARRIGRPRSARAVGNALNKNRYTSVIPCHRVVRTDGSIGGFARGYQAKLRLLSSEGIDIIGSKLTLPMPKGRGFSGKPTIVGKAPEGTDRP